MTSFLIVDVQSVKNTDSAEQKRYDAGKKVLGIKRHIAVDKQELPHATAMTTAKGTDRNGALQAMDHCRPNLERMENGLVNGGYTGQPFAEGGSNAWRTRRRSSSATNCTLLRCRPSMGSSNVPSQGWKSAGDYGRTANGNSSIPVSRSFTSPFSSFYAEDCEQALKFFLRE